MQNGEMSVRIAGLIPGRIKFFQNCIVSIITIKN